MTTEQEIAAGPELDARVAREVMGWHDFSDCWYDAENDIQENIRDWNPALDLDTSWQVVEHLCELGWRVTVSTWNDHGEQSECVMTSLDGGGYVSARCGDVTVAICRAALTAMTGDPSAN